MRTIIAGVLAAIIAMVVNEVPVRLFRLYGVVVMVPVIEEACKTFFAFYFNTGILLTHLIFGGVEAVYDLANAKKQVASLAAVVSILGHLVFGFVTLLAIEKNGSIVYGILSGSLVHIGWNALVILVFPNFSRRKDLVKR
jgi:hypothetical protein